MAKLLSLGLGISENPTALQPSLNDCIEVALNHAELLMSHVLKGLEAVVLGPRRNAALQTQPIRAAVELLLARPDDVGRQFRADLTRETYYSGGKDDNGAEVLRFEDLKLFEDADLDQSIEIARAQQEVSLAVDDVLPAFDARISTLLGWRTVQPGLNPLRPDVFVRALQACLATQVVDARVRESLIAPAAGLLGVNLRTVYRELSEWLTATGVEPAVPVGGLVQAGQPGTTGTSDRMSRTMLTLDRLRRLLAGDFHPAASPRRDFLHTVPASLVALQDLKQVDALVQRLEQRPAPEAPVADAAQPPAADAIPRLGHQLGAEVVRLMFDNLAQDARLLAPLKEQLRAMEPAVQRLAREDSRFFSDRTHPARQLLDVITQRSLAFPSATDEGWQRFMATVRDAAQWLTGKVVDADVVGELIDHLQAEWDRQDKASVARNAEAARALEHAERRHLLAQALATEFEGLMDGLDVPEFVRDFLRGAWPQVVAQARLTALDDATDPYGYRAVVDDLIWSVQKSTSRRGRAARLLQMIPGLIGKLRDGLARSGYPPELTASFFEGLGALHHAALQAGRDAAAQAAAQAAADAAEAAPSQFADSGLHSVDPWVAGNEAQESGYLGADSVMPADAAMAAHADEHAPVGAAGLVIGTWVELMGGDGQWLRVQLTWATPHGTLFMFTSPAGTAHSMSRRTLERLRAQGQIRVVAGRHVVDEALDLVARAALRNSLSDKP